MLGYRNTPAGPRMLRPWMVCLAGSWPPLADGRGCPAATRTREFIGPTGPDGPVGSRGGCRSASSRMRHAAGPGQPRACLTRPKSFSYHFAAEALLALL